MIKFLTVKIFRLELITLLASLIKATLTFGWSMNVNHCWIQRKFISWFQSHSLLQDGWMAISMSKPQRSLESYLFQILFKPSAEFWNMTNKSNHSNMHIWLQNKPLDLLFLVFTHQMKKLYSQDSCWQIQCLWKKGALIGQLLFENGMRLQMGKISSTRYLSDL